MIYTHLAAALVAVALTAPAIWKVQDGRYGAKEKERVESQMADERLAATARVRREEQVIDAQNKSETRTRAYRLDADGARAAADGLRTATAEALRSAAASHAACTERADSLGKLLVTVEEAGRNMAAIADGHANDAQTLMDAWPK